MFVLYFVYLKKKLVSGGGGFEARKSACFFFKSGFTIHSKKILLKARVVIWHMTVYSNITIPDIKRCEWWKVARHGQSGVQMDIKDWYCWSPLIPVTDGQDGYEQQSGWEVNVISPLPLILSSQVGKIIKTPLLVLPSLHMDKTIRSTAPNMKYSTNMKYP